MTSIRQTEQVATDVGRGGRNRPLLWTIGAIVLAMVAAVVVWVMVSGGEEQPTLSFDGTSTTYTGPETLQAGSVTFKLENTSDVTQGFFWARYLDESLMPSDDYLVAMGVEPIGEEGVTLEHEYAWIELHGTVPPWVDYFMLLPDVEPNTTIEATTELTAGRYVLAAQDLAAQKAYPGAIIEVVNE